MEDKKRKKYNRKSTGVTISIFYEHHQLNKYNYDPPYQRDYNVWEEEQKSFLIDTIYKNFPMPPIFLEQKIDTSNGKTTYDVIDGKQRLTTIIDFIEGKVTLPSTFSDGIYGYEKLNGLNFNQISDLSNRDETAQDFISDFWGYVISIEYIENPEIKVVDNIFDRLNRGGKRLNNQELRKANYYDSYLYTIIEELRNDKFISKQLENLDKNRLQDISFITELFILCKEEKILGGREDNIDESFQEIVDDISEEDVDRIKEKLLTIKNLVEQINIDYNKYRISGVSHLYAIWYLVFILNKKGIVIDKSISEKLEKFYDDLRNGGRSLDETTMYHKSMQSDSKSKSSRRKRLTALLNYFEIENPESLI